MTRFAVLLLAVFSLSGCYCMVEKGDATDISGYWNGCSQQAKYKTPLPEEIKEKYDH